MCDALFCCIGPRSRALGGESRGLPPPVRLCRLPGQCTPLCRAALCHSPPGQRHPPLPQPSSPLSALLPPLPPPIPLLTMTSQPLLTPPSLTSDSQPLMLLAHVSPCAWSVTSLKVQIVSVCSHHDAAAAAAYCWQPAPSTAAASGWFYTQVKVCLLHWLLSSSGHMSDCGQVTYRSSCCPHCSQKPSSPMPTL